MIRETEFYAAAERRIERLTWIAGAAAAAYSAYRYGWRTAGGVLFGTLVGWLNFRWLKQGINTALESVAQQSQASASAGQDAGVPGGTAEPERLARPPKRVYVRLLARYGLLLLAVYVILSVRFVPGIAVLGGLFSVVAAVLGELLYQVLFARET